MKIDTEQLYHIILATLRMQQRISPMYRTAGSRIEEVGLEGLASTLATNARALASGNPAAELLITDHVPEARE
jgi:hypothetical protein